MTMGIQLNNRKIAINNQLGDNYYFTPRNEDKKGTNDFIITNARSGHGGVEANGAKYTARRLGVFSQGSGTKRSDYSNLNSSNDPNQKNRNKFECQVGSGLANESQN